MLVRFFIILMLLVTTNIVFARENVNFLIDRNPAMQAVVGVVAKSIPLSGGFSGDEVYLVNNKFVLKKFKTYNELSIKIQKQAAKLGIAPNILYENSKERFVLMELVDGYSVIRDKHTMKNLSHFIKTLHRFPTKDMPKQTLLKKYKIFFNFYKVNI